MATATYPHIEMRPNGLAVIEGTRLQVVQVVGDVLELGLKPEQVVENYPGLELTPAKVYAALAYYHDNREEIEAAVAAVGERIAQMRSLQGESILRRKLEKRGEWPRR